MAHATGTFEVKGAADGQPETVDGISFSRWAFDKRLMGGLAGTSVVNMLAAATEDGQVRLYVAIERVTGVLDGRAGSFVLTHFGAVDPESQQLTVTIAPGLGTRQLVGLTGSMVIGDDHRYDLEYTLGG